MLGKTEKPILDNKYFIEKVSEKLPIDKETVSRSYKSFNPRIV